MEFEIKHDKKNEKFIIESEGETAYVSYSLCDDMISFNSTYTPIAIRGQGLAKLVVEEAFKFATENNFKVTSSCSYVLSFVQRYDKYKELMK